MFVLLFDQISKQVIVHGIRLNESIPVLEGFFNLVHIRNRGMAFGMMNRSETGFFFYMLLLFSLGAVFIILLWFLKLKNDDKQTAFGLSLILGGALGNLVDRIRLQEVIDFLDFYLGQYHWPAFNVADSAITVGTFCVALGLILNKKPEVE